MTVPQKVVELVERFDRNVETYKSIPYNETQLRREFLDPLFAALGWDVSNTQGYAEAYKDVIHEDAIKVGGYTKAPDYGFRIGGMRKFFLEAKKPSVDIKGDTHPAYQLRRYAWSAKLPLSILSDFEEFAVYDCRIKPVQTDRAATDYTPTYIVNYIIENTVGKLLKGKTPKQAEKLKILDPACGSGSFLIAYQYLLDWHYDFYVADGSEKWAKGRSPVLYQGDSGDFHLTTAERKRLLLNNIYGVDIDSQAVEVPKLSLLLKVLEGENEFSGNTYMPNMYEYFVAQGIRLIVENGYFGYIVPDRLGFNSQFIDLRREILKRTQVVSLLEFIFCDLLLSCYTCYEQEKHSST